MNPASDVDIFSNHQQTPFSDKLSQKVLDSLRSLNRSLNAMENNVAVIEHNLDSDDEFLQVAENTKGQKGMNGFVPSWQLRRELVLQGLESSEDETTEDGEFDFETSGRALIHSPPIATRVMTEENIRDTTTSQALRDVLIKLLRHSAGCGVTMDEGLQEELKKVLGTDPETAVKASEAKLPDRRAKAQAPPKAIGCSDSKQRPSIGATKSASQKFSTAAEGTEDFVASLQSETDNSKVPGNSGGGLTTPIIALPDSLGMPSPDGSPPQQPPTDDSDVLPTHKPEGAVSSPKTLPPPKLQAPNRPAPKAPEPEPEVPLGVEFGYTELPPFPLLPTKQKESGEEFGVDEWRDDYDPGYVLVQISEEEFLALEEEAAEAAQRTALAKQIRDQLTSWQKENAHLGKPKAQAKDKGLEDDMAAAEAALASEAGMIGREEGLEPNKQMDGSGDISTISNLTGPGGSFDAADGDFPRVTEDSPVKATNGEGNSVAPAVDAAPAEYSSPLKRLDTGLASFDLKVIYQKNRTGFEESKHFNPPLNEIVAGRYQVREFLGQAAFSTALQCVDLKSDNQRPKHVCLKVIKNNKDFFDQSLDEIKLLKYINSAGKPDRYHVLQMFDFFYYKEHLIIVSELLRENLYEFGKYIRDNNEEPYFTLPRLQKIMRQCLEALTFINRLNLIHCDIKPENIVIKSYSRVEIKMIDFGSSCYTTDHLTSYIQSRSYRAPEVVLGLPYGQRIDVWSLGCVLAEMLTGYVLFQNDSIQTMLARIQGVLEPFPDHMLEHGRDVPKYFTSNNLLYERIDDGEGSPGGFILIYPKKTSLRHRLHTDESLFLDFVTQTLSIDPAKRPTAEEALRHPWILEGLKLTPEEIAYCPT